MCNFQTCSFLNALKLSFLSLDLLAPLNSFGLLSTEICETRFFSFETKTKCKRKEEKLSNQVKIVPCFVETS